MRAVIWITLLCSAVVATGCSRIGIPGEARDEIVITQATTLGCVLAGAKASVLNIKGPRSCLLRIEALGENVNITITGCSVEIDGGVILPEGASLNLHDVALPFGISKLRVHGVLNIHRANAYSGVGVLAEAGSRVILREVVVDKTAEAVIAASGASYIEMSDCVVMGASDVLFAGLADEWRMQQCVLVVDQARQLSDIKGRYVWIKDNNVAVLRVVAEGTAKTSSTFFKIVGTESVEASGNVFNCSDNDGGMTGRLIEVIGRKVCFTGNCISGFRSGTVLGLYGYEVVCERNMIEKCSIESSSFIVVVNAKESSRVHANTISACHLTFGVVLGVYNGTGSVTNNVISYCVGQCDYFSWLLFFIGNTKVFQGNILLGNECYSLLDARFCEGSDIESWVRNMAYANKVQLVSSDRLLVQYVSERWIDNKNTLEERISSQVLAGVQMKDPNWGFMSNEVGWWFWADQYWPEEEERKWKDISLP